MKKNFLFGALALMLAGFWFGGASLATDYSENPHTNWEYMDWNDDYALNYYGDHGFDTHNQHTQTGTLVIDGNTITYSNLELSDEGDDGQGLDHIGQLGMMFFADTTPQVTADDLYLSRTTYYKNDANRKFSSLTDSYSSEDGRWHAAFWLWITPDLVKDALQNSGGIIQNTFVVSGDDRIETYTVNIDVTNFTQYNSKATFGQEDQVFFQVKDGKVVIENGKIASEVMDYAAFHSAQYSADHHYDSVITGEDFITFSGLKTKIYYPDEDPDDKDIAYVMVAFFQAGGDNDWSHIYFNGMSFKDRYDQKKSASNEDGRLHSSLWIRVTPDKIKAALENGEHNIVEKYAVTGDYKYIKDKEYTITINIDNVELYASGDSNDVKFKVVDGVITKIGGEDAVTVTFDGANKQVIASGTTAQKPSDPTKDCNSFDGWYNGETKFDFTTPVTGDLALTSKWTYTCSTQGGGGGSSKSSASSSNESKTDTKATTGDTAKVDEDKTDEKADEKTDEEKAGEEDKAPENAPMTEQEAIAKYGQEQIDAYKWALANGITTMDTVEKARLDQPLTRAELAKMMVVYIQKVLEKDPVLTGTTNYGDISDDLGDLAGYIQLAYQYQIMGIDANGHPIQNFNPNGKVTRGEYATVFSRVLFGSLFNKEGNDFYADHIKALEAAGILTTTDPTIQEIRGWVMLMMYRSSQNGDKIAEVAETLGATPEESAAAEEAAIAEVTTGDTAEAPAAEATTGDTAEVPAAEEGTAVVENQEAAVAEASTGDAAAEPSSN